MSDEPTKEAKLAAKPAEWCAPVAYRVMKAHNALAAANLELQQLLHIHGLQGPVVRKHAISITNAETAFLFSREVHETLAEMAVAS